MIIRDEDVQAALDWLNQQPHPTAVAKYKLAEAKNNREKTHAQLYLNTEGTRDERNSKVEVDSSYHVAKVIEAMAVRDLADAQQRDVWADKVTGMYQTVSANTRYAERIR